VGQGLAFNTNEASKLWNLLGFGGDKWAEIRCVDMNPDCPKDKRVVGREWVNEKADFIKTAQSLNGRGNCFIGRNPRRGFHERNAVMDIRAVTLDLDPIREKDKAATEPQTKECVDAAYHLLEGLQDDRSIDGSLALSGNGVLLIFTLDSPLEANKWNEERIRLFQNNCAERIKLFQGVRIDATQDSARLIKLIGTVSVKGGIRGTRFLYMASRAGNGEALRHHISDLDICDFPSGDKMFVDKPVDNSRSGRDFSFACQLAKRGATDEELLTALAFNPEGRNDRPDDHKRILQKVRRLFPLESVTAASPNSSGGDIVLHRAQSSVEDYKLHLLERSKHIEPELPTGFSELDSATHGLRRGEIYTVAARPGVGKSSFLLNVAYRLCSSGVGVLLLSTEMSFPAIWDRVASIATGIGGECFAKGSFGESERLKLEEHLVSFKSKAFTVCDSFTPNIKTVEQAVINAKPDVLMFDHIQHIAPDGNGEVKGLSAFTRGLKDIAMRHNCAVLVASQLRRPHQMMDFASKRTVFARPSINDLKGCGTIEEESAFVLVMSPSDDKIDETTVVINCDLAKNRFGPNVFTSLVFDKPITKFKSLVEA
jgi:archaellum biogenesis ATPase FlaH